MATTPSTPASHTPGRPATFGPFTGLVFCRTCGHFLRGEATGAASGERVSDPCPGPYAPPLAG